LAAPVPHTGATVVVPDGVVDAAGAMGGGLTAIVVVVGTVSTARTPSLGRVSRGSPRPCSSEGAYQIASSKLKRTVVIPKAFILTGMCLR